MKQRINWIDVSRGLAFLMVIYSHLPMCNDRLMKFFSPVFLTTFFFVSGYLFKSGERFSKVLEQRVRTLLLPFVFLGLILIGLSQIVSFNEQVGFVDSVKGLFFQYGENQILWFIGALFVYSLFFYVLDACCKSVSSLLIVSALLFVVNSVLLHWFALPSIPWHIECLGCSCFYMALGRCYREYECKIDAWFNWKILLLGMTLYIAYIFISDIYIGHYGSFYVLDSMLITIIGLALIIVISKKYLNGSKFLLFVGSNTLLYFALHGKVYSAILAVGGKIFPKMMNLDDAFGELLVAFSIVLLDSIILIPPSLAVNKFIPQLLGKKFRLWKLPN